ncbi:unnamed protein product [Kuraishia capsulata CBS 1993]|uniref:C2H2-type domain-containing protein n=1 Tax=Kuraishia capsulata CBS 1993 TaxID=1382522 RepID=W6MPF7_9ASCO|nr:uncharacterized protein KUCA_T00004190001 [Kuraishia capsulata CBS 1993]CDK28208.1 unnamed protein product [Kuraishia capsulata CBS 1993]
MSGKEEKVNSFGRRTWDKEEYARLARERVEEIRNKRNGKNTEPKKTKAHDFFKQRMEDLKKIDSMNKISLVADSVTGGWFACEVCRRKYKDNLAYIEHLNSNEHLQNSGFDARDQQEVTLEQVKDRLETLKRIKDEERLKDDTQYDIRRRIEIKRKRDEEEALRKKQRTEKKRKKVAEKTEPNETTNDPMMTMMGFSSFK